MPTGQVSDVIDGIEITCVDNGMPVVVARAADLGITGYEPYQDLAQERGAGGRIQALRLAAGKLMGIGDVAGLSVPKTTLVSPPRDGGTICTRTFIPVRPHQAIGVLGAVSVATALLLPGGVGAELAARPTAGHRFDIEHPTGHLEVDVNVDVSEDPPQVLQRRRRQDRAQALRRDRLPARSHAIGRQPMPLLHEVAHLGHAELLTPEPERSLWFFTEVLGLTENGSDGSSVYLRTWDDYEHHSLKLTASATSGLRRTGLRAASEEALQAQGGRHRGGRPRDRLA